MQGPIRLYMRSQAGTPQRGSKKRLRWSTHAAIVIACPERTASGRSRGRLAAPVQDPNSFKTPDTLHGLRSFTQNSWNFETSAPEQFGVDGWITPFRPPKSLRLKLMSNRIVDMRAPGTALTDASSCGVESQRSIMGVPLRSAPLRLQSLLASFAPKTILKMPLILYPQGGALLA